ncbi:MAG: hypothetical protein WBM40_21690 [Thiohalocapsa sp.]
MVEVDTGRRFGADGLGKALSVRALVLAPPMDLPVVRPCRTGTLLARHGHGALCDGRGPTVSDALLRGLH